MNDNVTNRTNSTKILRWSLVGVLALTAGGLLVSLSLRASAAPANSSAFSGAGGVFVTGGRISGETYGLFLVDQDKRTISVYELAPKARKNKLRLMASRTYAYDVRLDEYNTTPSPREVRRLVEQHKRLETK